MVGALVVAAPAPAAQAQDADASVLVFSKTAEFRHASIPDGIAMIERLGEANDFTVTSTEDAAVFNDDDLGSYDAVVFLSTTGDVLDGDQQAAFERYIQAGGGYAGIHAASDTEYDWAWYGDLVGAYFEDHPAIQEATIVVNDRVHPSTEHLPLQWTRTDEWYNFQSNPTGDVHVLAGLDEGSYDAGAGAMGFEHPIAWCQDFDGGRSWYTGMGHTTESFTDPAFEEHVLGGIQTVAGLVESDCGATVPENYEAVKLTSDIGEPMTMDIAPDGRVFYTSRRGALQVYDPDTGQVTDAANLEVFSGLEDGLIGIAFDPDFATNQQIYIHYSVPPADTDTRRISRFEMDGNTLDLDSEIPMLEWFTQRDVCCHTAGDMAWDSEGNLYVSTGDNTNSMASDGMTPIDEREGRSAFDAQRTSGNTNDLSGKILRIHPEDDGTYTIPEGNLQDLDWAADKDQSLIRDEIYVMGLRNPFRIWVDPETDWLYWGNVGPDATNAIGDRGPAAYDEWDVAKSAGNYGWPYCSGPNTPYHDYDFATGESGPEFDCEGGPTNDSPNNTGVTELPPAIGADIWYPRNNPPEQFPWIEAGGGNTAMGGVIYDYDADNANETKFPEYFDGKWFVYEWSREFFKVLTMDPETEFPIHVDDFPQADPLVRGMDMEFGPDGHLYILDYGTGYFSGSPEAGLWRIDYTGGRVSPVPSIDAEPTSGQAPLEVSFDGTGSSDPNGDDLTYEWDFDDDGTVDATGATVTHTYTEAGEYDARLTVTDPAGNDGTITTSIVVGNTAPEVTITTPPEGGFVAWGEDIPFTIEVDDAEDGSTADGTIDCSRVEVSFVTGHDAHGHPQSTVTGCEGTLSTGDPGDGHGLDANVFGIVAASYTDDAQGEVGAITTTETIQLQPKHRQAEHFDETGSIDGDTTAAIIGAGGAEGDARVGDIQDGEWIRFSPVNFQGIESMDFRVSSGGAGGDIEVRVDAPDGPLVATVAVTDTGSYDTYEMVSADVTDPGGTHDMYLVFTNPDADGALFDVDAFWARGKGIAEDALPTVESVTASPEVGAAPLEVAFEAVATDPEDTTLTHAWDFGDGTTGDGATPTHTYDSGGIFDVTVTVTDEAGLSATGSTTVEVYAPADECLRTEDGFCVLDVSAYTNNDGIASAEAPGDGNFDGGGWSYPAEEMPGAGAVTLAGVPWEFPTLDDAVTQNIEARGQTIGLHPDSYGQLHLLASAHNGSVDTTATVIYTDGSSSEVPIQFTDWAQSPSFGEDVAVAAGYRYNSSGETTPPVNIFHQSVPLDPSREPALLTLPGDDRFHVFGVTLDTATLTPNLDLAPATGEPEFGDDYTLTAELATGGVPMVGNDVRFEVYRLDEDATPPAGTDGDVYTPVTDTTSATGDDGTTTFTYSHDAAADDIVVACTGTDDCVTDDVLVVDDAGDPVNLASDAETVDTATVTWSEGLELEEGFAWLFDGSQELFDVWQQAGPGSFTLENGAMVSQGGLGLFWYPEQEYENFTLRLQWKAEEATDNSGVFVRFPDPGDDPGVAIDEGHEIQIYDATTGEPQRTGSIYNADREDDFNSNPPGSWNDYEITVEGREYTVSINGEVINTYTDTQGKGLQGFIGLQNHGDADVVSFRNVRIAELEPSEPGPVLDAVGITDHDHLGNGAIPGTTSFAAELVPDADSSEPAPDDTYDDVVLRMPADTSGAVPNVAGTNGQVLELSEEEQGVYDSLHVFGTATDAGQGTVSGDFVLEFADGSTETVTVTQSDWGYPALDDASNHIAIGPMEYRHNADGDQYAPVPFYVYDAVVSVESDQPLVSITFPTDITATEPGGTPEELWTLGITGVDGDTQVGFDLAEDDGEEPDETAPTVEGALLGTFSGEFTPEPGESISGTGQLVVADDGTQISVDLAGLEPGASYAGHLHEGTCEAMPMGGHYQDDPDGAEAPPNELWLVDDQSDPEAGFTADGSGEAQLSGQATWTARVEARSTMIHGGDAGLPIACVTLDTSTEPVEIVVDATDDVGVETVEYRLATSGEWGDWTMYDGTVTVTEPGEYTVEYRATDAAGNVSAVGDASFVIAEVDDEPPTVDVTLDPAEPNGDPVGDFEGTYNTPVTVTVEADDGDGSGVETIEYALDGGDWTTWDGPITVESEGEHTVEARAIDAAGNTSEVEAVSFTIREDACPGSDLSDTVTVGDVDSGVDNHHDEDGCTVEDLLDDEDQDFANHGEAVRHVRDLTADLVDDGLLTRSEKRDIDRAAARSDLGK
nr:ThuA domain-containing protein [Salsipaludibacter albus]